MHKITDTVKKHKHKYEDKVEYLSIAEAMINHKYDQGDKHFYLFVDIDNDKIYGSFTNDDMDLAVTHYLQQNYNALINPLLNARDNNGKKIHDAPSAILEVKKRLMNYRK
jgi:hypothetical protein